MGVAHFWEKQKQKSWRFGYQIISSIINLVVNSLHIVTILMFLHKTTLLADVAALGIFPKLHPGRWMRDFPGVQVAKTLHNEDLACHS